MKSQVLHTVWFNISCEAAGEIWNWSLLRVKHGLNLISVLEKTTDSHSKPLGFACGVLYETASIVLWILYGLDLLDLRNWNFARIWSGLKLLYVLICLTFPYVWPPSSEQDTFNPFTPKSDQIQISPAASPVILHHTVWRTWLFIAYSDGKWFPLPNSHYLTYTFIFKKLGECTFGTWEWKG